MDLLEQFLLREKIERHLADAQACHARAKAAVAAIEGYAAETAALFDEARRHVEALRANGWDRTKETLE